MSLGKENYKGQEVCQILNNWVLGSQPLTSKDREEFVDFLKTKYPNFVGSGTIFRGENKRPEKPLTSWSKTQYGSILSQLSQSKYSFYLFKGEGDFFDLCGLINFLNKDKEIIFSKNQHEQEVICLKLKKIEVVDKYEEVGSLINNDKIVFINNEPIILPKEFVKEKKEQYQSIKEENDLDFKLEKISTGFFHPEVFQKNFKKQELCEDHRRKIEKILLTPKREAEMERVFSPLD